MSDRTARLAFQALGGRCLVVIAAPPDRATSLLIRARHWVDAWEARLSRFRPASELSRLNRSAGRWVRVSRDLWTVLQAAEHSRAETAGLVVPTVLPAVIAAGYDRTFAALAAGSGPARQLSRLPGTGLEFDPTRRAVRLTAGAGIDLGGVAKGWIADRVARRLGRTAPAIFDAGGDIAISAPPPGQPGWAIGVAHPLDPSRPAAVLQIARGGIATSGRDFRRWQRAGQDCHHIIDPRRAAPAVTDALSATVLAPTARQAEAAAKAAFILGIREGLTWLDARPHFAGLLFDVAGRAYPSTRWDDSLWR